MVPQLLSLLTQRLRPAAGALAAALWCACAPHPALAQAELSAAIERVKPSVVMVGTLLRTGSPQFTLHGAGFAVTGNLVATNAHVIAPIRGEPEKGMLVVRIPAAQVVPGAPADSQMRMATLHSSDEIHDLALLRIDGPPLPALALGESGKVREGAAVAFTGFPIGDALGFSPVTHRGIVSAITSIAPPTPSARTLDEKQIRAIKAGAFQVFQLDATAYPGNSGGPLFDPDTGKVLGVVNRVFVKGARESALSQPSGISYAVPARYLEPLIREASEKLTPAAASQ
jgi:serine protease Do